MKMNQETNRKSFSQAGLMKNPIAHRGLHRYPEVPENSLHAFKAAITRGLPVELDVRLLADGQVVVIHDSNLKRMTGQARPVSTLTTDEVRKSFLLNTQERLPLLAEALELINGQVPVLIELKTFRLRAGALEEAVLQTLQGYTGEFALQSFNSLSLIWLRRNAPQIWRGQLSAGWMGVPLKLLAQPDFVAFALPRLTGRIATATRRKTPILAWTVQNARDLKTAQSHADNFIFDSSVALERSLR